MLGKALALMVALVLFGTACGDSDEPGATATLSGTITGDGSSTVFPVTEAVAEEFGAQQRKVQVTVGVSGTGGGFEKFCNGETDLQNASRPIKDEEKAICTAKSIDYLELTVANDGLAVVVNPKNTWAQCLTTAELKKIWAPGSKVKNWNEIRSDFPDQALKLFGPGTDSGTFDYFTKEINGEEGASRTDYTGSEDDNVLVQGVAGDDGALGYFGFAYYSENTDKLKVLGVDNGSGSGCVVPSDETVKANTYAPLSRPLLLYVKRTSLTKPEVRAFIEFYLDNVNALLADVGYTPLADATLATEKAEFEAAVGG